ncbi:MAG: flagellar hook protein FlgE [Treponema sp.]|jgi:flagellar hook protein FlgE|nr:flagellar hook protein FlgE [Treponema sp.]
MMRSLFSGVSGLQNHQTRMDVIGNNISNINTRGFKRNRVNFQDILYQQLQGAASPTEDIGGVNPKEVGLGMSIASIDTIHIQGTLETTGVQTDLAITGQGFFILDDMGKQLFTRAGAFSIDADGVMVNPANGMRVMGWMAREVEGYNILDVSSPVGQLTIPVGDKDPARATAMVNFACNLDKRIPELPENPTGDQVLRSTWSTTTKIYDSFGDEHLLQVEFTRVPGTANSWNAAVNVDPQNEVPTNATIGFGEDAPAAGGPTTFIVNFSNNGTLLSAEDGAGNVSGASGQVQMYVAYDVQTATLNEDGTPVRQEFVLNLGNVGSYTNSLTQYAEASSSKAISQDGRTMGYLDNFTIDSSGLITGVYSNGSTRALGQVALATFPNQGGLEKAGDNTFRVSNNSGMANIGPSGVAGKGKIVAGALEMSNVDMADQFVDMIVTQRGFQANSRTIQTADQLLQELLTLKR